MHASYPSIQGAAAGGLPGVGGQPGLQCEAKKKKKEEKPKHKLNLKDTSISREPRIPSARVPQCSWSHVIRTPKLTLRGNRVPRPGGHEMSARQTRETHPGTSQRSSDGAHRHLLVKQPIGKCRPLRETLPHSMREEGRSGHNYTMT